MKKLFYLVFALSLFTVFTLQETNAQSQGHFCATDDVRRDLIGRNPLLLDAESINEELLQNAILEMRSSNRDEEPVLVIPVVFHIIHNYGDENVPDAQVHSAINILNRDYRMLNTDINQVVNEFDTLIADCKIEFRLATKDFMGNCTNGIERIASTRTYDGYTPSVKINQWPRDRYLNIWVVNDIPNDSPGQTLGYAIPPPGVVGDFFARLDGIVVRYDSFGVAGVGQADPGKERTLTHEVGHYLNLIHTWGNGEVGVACGDTDAVDDTPETKGHFGGCVLADFDCLALSLPTTPIYQFGNVTTTSGLVDPTPSLQTTNNNITLSPFSANGVSANPIAEGTFGFSNWGTGAPDGYLVYVGPHQNGNADSNNYHLLTGSINTSKYYQVTITPTPGRATTLATISFWVKRSLTGPRSFAIRSNMNDYASNINITSTSPNISAHNNTCYFREDTTSQFYTGITVTLPTASFSRKTSPVTFRIYAWNGEDSEGTFEIDNVTISGSHGQIANAQNYMDYSDCTVMFTEGQKERMRAALNVSTASRNNLWTEENRVNTGTWSTETPVCTPIADFYAQRKFACANTPIQFRDNSTNAPVTSWSWTFQDGSPATSNEQNPVVSFTSGGYKAVTLTVTGAAGEDTKTIQNVVRIAYTSPEFWDIPLSEGFDSPERFWNLWIPVNVDNTPSNWTQISNAGYSNNTSARLNAFDMVSSDIYDGTGAVDELVSPSFVMSGLSGVTMSFRWAFATQSPNVGGITDVLRVLISTDCGATWATFSSGSITTSSGANVPFTQGTISGLTLVTAGHFSTAFVPTEADQWNYATVNFPGGIPGNSRVRFKFEFTSGSYPNNIYIDDVNINATVGIDEAHSDFYGVNLYPNPSSSATTLVYTNKTMAPLQISLIDMSGRVVESWTPNVTAPGQQTLNIDTANLAKGVYMVNMRSEQSNVTLRLLVQ